VNLYIVYLGGSMLSSRMGEDHEVMAVVAADVPAACKAAKAKWQGLGDPHVDAVRHLDVIGGYQVTLVRSPADQRDVVPLDPTWVP